MNFSKVAKSRVKSELCTVLFVDIVEYSRATGNLSRDEFSQLHDSFDMICKATFEKHSGEVIKKVGDGYIVIFSSATDAIICAVDLQYMFAGYNKGRQNKMYIRTALNTGDVIKKSGDIYGEAVNIASRIENIAHATDILLSEATFRASNANTIPYRFIGTKKLKGIKYPVKIFKVKKPYTHILGLEERKDQQRIQKVFRNIIVDGSIILLILCGLFALAWLVWYLL